MKKALPLSILLLIFFNIKFTAAQWTTYSTSNISFSLPGTVQTSNHGDSLFVFQSNPADGIKMQFSEQISSISISEFYKSFVRSDSILTDDTIYDALNSTIETWRAIFAEQQFDVLDTMISCPSGYRSAFCKVTFLDSLNLDRAIYIKYFVSDFIMIVMSFESANAETAEIIADRNRYFNSINFISN